MKIEKMTKHDALNYLGNLATEEEAIEFLGLLYTTPYLDTDDIPDSEWSDYIRKSIVLAKLKGVER